MRQDGGQSAGRGPARHWLGGTPFLASLAGCVLWITTTAESLLLYAAVALGAPFVVEDACVVFGPDRRARAVALVVRTLALGTGIVVGIVEGQPGWIAVYLVVAPLVLAWERKSYGTIVIDRVLEEVADWLRHTGDEKERFLRRATRNGAWTLVVLVLALLLTTTASTRAVAADLADQLAETRDGAFRVLVGVADGTVTIVATFIGDDGVPRTFTVHGPECKVSQDVKTNAVLEPTRARAFP